MPETTILDTASAEIVPVQPVEALVAPRPHRSRLRWLVAAVVTALVVSAAGGATLLLTGAAGDAQVLAWAPADSIAYTELRLDLPGSQHAQVAQLLSAFPGFADLAALGTKLGEVFDRLVKAVSGGKHDYQTEIAPWFGGQVAVAVRPPDKLAAGASATQAAASAHALVLVYTTDTAKATAWLAGLLTEVGATTTSDSYGGVAVTVVHAGSVTPGAAGPAITMPDAAYAVLGSVLVAGDIPSVHAAIDTRGTTGLGSVTTFRTAAAALSGDRVAFFWADTAAILDQAGSAITGSGANATLSSLFGALKGASPAWTAGAVRAVDGSLVVDGVEPSSTTAQPAVNRTSRLAALVPASTILLVDTRDGGTALAALRDRLAADPSLAPAMTSMEQTLGVIGGFDAATSWIGDAGLAVTRSGSTVSGGVVIQPADAAGAKRFLTQVRSLAELAGAAANVIPTFTDTTYGDAVVTTVDVAGLGNLLSLAAGAAGASGTTGLGNPSALLGAMPGKLSFAYAVTPQVVVIGADAAFVKAVLDARSGPSLATDPRFSALLSRAGATNTGLAWVDVAAVRTMIEGLLPADALASYNANIKPYLSPIDALITTDSVGGGLAHSTMILSTIHP